MITFPFFPSLHLSLFTFIFQFISFSSSPTLSLPSSILHAIIVKFTCIAFIFITFIVFVFVNCRAICIMNCFLDRCKLNVIIFVKIIFLVIHLFWGFVFICLIFVGSLFIIMFELTNCWNFVLIENS